jgi:hypothetical protein
MRTLLTGLAALILTASGYGLLNTRASIVQCGCSCAYV